MSRMNIAILSVIVVVLGVILSVALSFWLVLVSKPSDKANALGRLKTVICDVIKSTITPTYLTNIEPQKMPDSVNIYPLRKAPEKL